jgi:hypothetical protein
MLHDGEYSTLSTHQSTQKKKKPSNMISHKIIWEAKPEAFTLAKCNEVFQL